MFKLRSSEQKANWGLCEIRFLALGLILLFAASTSILTAGGTMAPGRYQETSHLKKKDGKDPLRTAAQYDANRRLPQLCGKLEKNKPIPADPSTFRQVLRSLRPGETMLLAPGDYPPLKIVGLRGGR